MTDLVVGCPVRQRSWIIDDWFEHVEVATRRAGLEVVYALVGDRRDLTVQILKDRCLLAKRRLLFTHVDEDVTAPDERQWNELRFARMVVLRNVLLGMVREAGPRHFLSLDSDILLGKDTLVGLCEAIENFDAVGGATWMTPTSRRIPNCGWLKGQRGLIRPQVDHEGVIPVGVIMALKLMAPSAYAVDYELHAQGEDLGWSAACARAGVRLGWDNRWPSKHVMSPAALGAVDARVGW